MITILRKAIPLLVAGIGLTAGPSLLANGRDALAAGSGDGHVLVIGEGNTLWAWGANGAGQLGSGSTAAIVSSPVRVGSSSDWAYVAAGAAHSAAIKTDGSLWTWGANESGQLGRGITAASSVPVRIAESITLSGRPIRWVAVSARANYTAAIAENGALYVWGAFPEFRSGQSGTVGSSLSPIRVGLTTDTYFAVAAGNNHVLALRGAATATSGALYGWGVNVEGQVDGTIKASGFPVTKMPVSQIPLEDGSTPTDWSRVAAGDGVSAAIRASGSLYTWGRSALGQLGLGDVALDDPAYRPRLVGADFDAVLFGGTHTLALRGDGELWGWGQNGSGQLGLPLFDEFGAFLIGNTQSTSPVRLATDAGYDAIAAGVGTTVALLDGVVVSAGNNASGQLGNGSTESQQNTLAPASFGFPDLRVSQVRTIPATFIPGDTITVEVSLVNEGSGAVEIASNVRVGLRMSRTTEFDSATATLNDAVPVSVRIAPAQTTTVSASVTIPGSLAAGDYFLVARADVTGVLAEINEANNDGATAPPAYRFLPDLTVPSTEIVFAAGLNLNRQSPLTVSFRVANVGQVNLVANSGLTGNVILTKDNLLGNADDVVLAPFTVAGSIPRQVGTTPGYSSTITVNGTIPGSVNPGEYRVGVQLDVGSVEEISTANNVTVRTNQTLTISEASAIPLSTSVDLAFSGFTDPYFNTPTPFVAPAIAFTGSGSWYGIAADLPAGVTDGDVGRTPVLNNPGDTAGFSLTLRGPFTVSFRWRMTSLADEVRFTMDGQVLDVIDGDENWRQVTLVIPGSVPPRVIAWTYVRNSARADDPTAVAYVDNISITGLNQPDLVVTQLDYNNDLLTGPVETFVVGRDTPLPVQIVGTNRGIPVPPSTNPASNQFEVEVRLSRDRVWGNADDYVLGRLDELERLDASQRYVYSRHFRIDDCAITSGNYYVGARVDSTGLYSEFDEVNNISWSALPDVRVEKRPQIRVRALTYTPGVYYREQELPVSFEIANVGCEDIAPGQTVQTVVRFVGFSIDYAIQTNGGLTVTETRQANLERTLVTIRDTGGIRAGEAASFVASFQVPEYMEKNLFPIYHPAKITYRPEDIVPRLPDFSIEVDDGTVPKGYPLPLFGSTIGTERNPVFFFFEFESTSTVPLVEEIIVQTFGQGESTLDTIGQNAYTGTGILVAKTPFLETYADFAAKYPLADGPEADSDGDGYTNLQEWAFVSDPRVARFSGANAATQGSPAVGLVDVPVLVEGAQVTRSFLSASFHVLSSWSNGGGVTYVVEFADNAGFTTNLTTVTIPAGATLNQVRQIPGVVSAADFTYSYRVLVRDTLAATSLGARFARVRIVAP